MKTSIKFAACALAFSALTAFGAEKKAAEEVAVKDLPAAVTQSVTTKWPNSSITNAKKQVKGEATVYKVKVKAGSDVYLATIAADGTIKKSKEKE